MADFIYEDEYKLKIIAGVDEAGRGPLAGPVVAAAVIVDRLHYIEGIKDSKKVSKAKRERLAAEIKNKYIYSVGIVNPDIIDQINILEATKQACIRAVDGLTQSPEHILVDGNMKFQQANYRSIIKGDDKSYSIAAASIIAKVTRDQIMLELAAEYPEYLWHKNSGYGTAAHIEAIRKYGLCKHHRKCFKVSF